MTAAKQLRDIEAAVSDALAKNGTQTLSEYNEANTLMLAWVRYLHQTQLTGKADYMLEGVGALIRECAAYLSMGLVRTAWVSMRGQIDLTLSWIYFKDHPIELAKVESTGDGYMLVSDVLKYIKEINPKFGQRFTVLDQVSKRKTKDPFRLLSGHVHGQSLFVIPKVNTLDQVVQPAKTCHEAVTLQQECWEYISDILLALNLDDWAAIPDEVKRDFDARTVSGKQKTALFS